MWNYTNPNEQDPNQTPSAAPEQPKNVMPAQSRKSKGLAVFFGLLPGAGHMYLGKMKRGLTFMALFAGIIAVASVLEMGVVVLALPVLWFYAFFDNLNLASMTPEQREAAPDELLFGLWTREPVKQNPLFKKRVLLLGWGFIAVGGVMLFRMVVGEFLDWADRVLCQYQVDLSWLWSIYHNLPQIVIAVLIIVLGVYFVRGGKKKQPADDIPPYRGE